MKSSAICLGMAIALLTIPVSKCKMSFGGTGLRYQSHPTASDGRGRHTATAQYLRRGYGRQVSSFRRLIMVALGGCRIGGEASGDGGIWPVERYQLGRLLW